MDKPEIDRLLATTEAQFEAAIAAEEDAAADDLALSLLQGSDLSILLCRSPWLLLRPSGGTAAVTLVGPDCVLATAAAPTAEVVVPLASALFVPGTGAPPTPTLETFLEVLRRRVRTGERLRALVGENTFEGRVRLVTGSHAVLARPHGDVIIPLSELREVQLGD